MATSVSTFSWRKISGFTNNLWLSQYARRIDSSHKKHPGKIYAKIYLSLYRYARRINLSRRKHPGKIYAKIYPPLYRYAWRINPSHRKHPENFYTKIHRLTYPRRSKWFHLTKSQVRILEFRFYGPFHIPIAKSNSDFRPYLPYGRNLRVIFVDAKKGWVKSVSF